MIWLYVVFIFAAAAWSVMIHEEGHALAARALGGKAHGWHFRWYGVGMAVEVPVGRMWVAAGAGLLATFLAFCASFGLAQLSGPLGLIFGWLALLNALILVSQLLPWPGLDGWWVGKALVEAVKRA